MKTARQHTDGLLRGCAKDIRPAVAAAVRQHWTLNRPGKGHMILTSPDGQHRIAVPANTRSPGMIRSFRKRLTEHGVNLDR